MWFKIDLASPEILSFGLSDWMLEPNRSTVITVMTIPHVTNLWLRILIARESVYHASGHKKNPPSHGCQISNLQGEWRCWLMFYNSNGLQDLNLSTLFSWGAKLVKGSILSCTEDSLKEEEEDWCPPPTVNSLHCVEQQQEEQQLLLFINNRLSLFWQDKKNDRKGRKWGNLFIGHVFPFTWAKILLMWYRLFQNYTERLCCLKAGWVLSHSVCTQSKLYQVIHWSVFLE